MNIHMQIANLILTLNVQKVFGLLLVKLLNILSKDWDGCQLYCINLYDIIAYSWFLAQTCKIRNDDIVLIP